MQYDEHLRRQLRNITPPDGVKVVLIGDVEADSTRRYPAEGFYNFWEDVDLDVPNGTYLLRFFTGKENPLKTDGAKYLKVQRPQDQARLADGRSASQSVAATPDSARALILPEHHRELSSVEVNLRAATAEFQKHKMVVSMQKDAIGLARASRHTQELQEQAALNQTYRLEMQAMAETHSNITRRHVEHSAKMIEVLGLTSEMMGSVVSNLQKAAGLIGQPPPAPVDYGETIVKSIGMLGGLALQMVSMLKGGPAPKLPDPSDDSVEAELADKPAHTRTPNKTNAETAKPATAVYSAPIEEQSSSPTPRRDNPPKVGPTPAALWADLPKAAPETPRDGLRANPKADPEPSRNAPRVNPHKADPEPSRDALRASPPKADPEPVTAPVRSSAPNHELEHGDQKRDIDSPATQAAAERVPDRQHGTPPPRHAGKDAVLDQLVKDFVEGSSDAERAIPVHEHTAEPSGVDFFLSSQNEPQLDQLVALLRKFRHHRELDQLIAHSAPHLAKKADS